MFRTGLRAIWTPGRRSAAEASALITDQATEKVRAHGRGGSLDTPAPESGRKNPEHHL